MHTPTACLSCIVSAVGEGLGDMPKGLSVCFFVSLCFCVFVFWFVCSENFNLQMCIYSLGGVGGVVVAVERQGKK